MQSVPPLIIITGAVALMGAIVGGLHKVRTGEERRLGRDQWDFDVGLRDKRIKKQEK